MTAARLVGTTVSAAAVWVVVAAVALCVGSTGGVGWPSGFALTHRLDVVLLASLVGAALATAGVGYQAVLRNPLAEPYLLGTAGGAALAAYAVRLGGLPVLTETVAAFGGALLAVVVVLGVAGRRGSVRPTAVILTGVIVASICGAAFALLYALNRDSDPFAVLIGDVRSNLPAGPKWVGLVLLAIGYAVTAVLAGKLNAATLGDDEAAALGVRVGQLRVVVLLAASLTVAGGVALAGPIGFVGLVGPHIARLLVGADVRRLLPIATAGGAVLMVGAEALSRVLSRPEALNTGVPVGVWTALLGGPLFIALLRRSEVRDG
ncbi:MAG: iron ABC transporter permease [Planctomycetota bacterium]